MYLKKINLANFKNYESAEFDFNAKVNGIVGENGCGKTNLLDAIHYLSFCKSYFVSQDAFAVRFDEDFFAIHGVFNRVDETVSDKISCTYKTGGRKIMKANGKEYERLSDHIGRYPLIMVSPYDHDIINDGSDLRRKFFDVIISQFDKEYLHQLISYQKILMQRNIHLKQCIESRNYDKTLIHVFDAQLIPLGAYIHQKRKEFIAAILPVFKKYYQDLSGNREEVDIQYESGLHESSMEEGLDNAISLDFRCGYTNFGIHKDDFLFYINGNSVKRYGSQGQQKSFALGLKLSEFEYIYQQKQQKPILLLDDIFDKLDPKRTAHLLDLVGRDFFGQVFISDTDEQRVTQILTRFGISHSLHNVSQSGK